jgi:hypothetical protein
MRASRNRVQLLALLACTIAAAMAITDSAMAGTYVIRNCNVPGETGRAIGPWHWDPSTAGGTFGHDECASGGGFGINAGTMPWGYSTGVTLETPPAIAIRRTRLWLVVRLRSTGSSLFSNVVSGNANTANPVDLFGSPGGSTLASPYVSPLLASDTHIYLVLIGCAGGTGEPCTAIDSNVLDIRGVETTLEENTPPAASLGGGELVSDGPQAGIRQVSYASQDQESGVARVSVIVGTTVVGTSDFASECAYASLAACPQSRGGSIAADTRKVPDGIYPVSLRVTDAAGNVVSTQAAKAINVINGAASTAGSSPSAGEAPAGAKMTASFAANRRSKLTVAYGQRVVVRGRVRDADGTPLGGATVDVEERTASNSASDAPTTVKTDPTGLFVYRAGVGPSRTLVFTYRGGPVLVNRLTLRVKASASLHVALNGIVVRYSGKVQSRPLPRRGKLVEVQGRAPGGGWKTFATRRTTRDGVFSGTYRLRVHRPGVHLQFRVRLPSERGYPFVGHTGAPVTRRVR